jgi:short-subunit dehydrogenase
MLRRGRDASRSEQQTVVIVTGASRSIGLVVCRRFGAEGARVGMIARDAAVLESASATVPGTVATATADVVDRAALAGALDALADELGAPTVLVNNAGLGSWGAVADTDADSFRRAIDVNYLGAVNTIAHVLPGMLARACGRVVNVASIAGRIGAPFEAAYSASKFALVGYSEALAIELAGTGVTVSLIHPGPVETEFFRTRGHRYELRRPRPVPAERVAEAVVKAVHRDRHEMFVPAWLGLAYAAKVAAPPLYRHTTQRLFARQRRDLRERLGP